MSNTLRVLDFFVSLHLTIFERPVNCEYFEQSAKRPGRIWLTATPTGLGLRGFAVATPGHLPGHSSPSSGPRA
jgi:hypothetical protein